MAFSWLKPPLRDDRGNAVELILSRTAGCSEWPVSGDERIARVRERIGTVLGRPVSVPLPSIVVALCAFSIAAIMFAWAGPRGLSGMMMVVLVPTMILGIASMFSPAER